MIRGVGIDIIEVERVRSKVSADKGFRELVFSADEIAYCEARANPYEHYGARFAAKEAFFKALGTGWAKGTAFNEIEIVHDENGKPGLHFLGNTAVTLDFLSKANIAVSLTHVSSTASAVVIIEEF